VGFKICWLGFSGRSRDEVPSASATDTIVIPTVTT